MARTDSDSRRSWHRSEEQTPGTWQPGWTASLTEGIGRWTDRKVEVEFLAYDDIFARKPPSAGDVMEAFVSSVGMVSSRLPAISSAVAWPHRGPSRRALDGRNGRPMDRRRSVACSDPRARSGEVPTGTGWDVVAAHSLGVTHLL